MRKIGKGHKLKIVFFSLSLCFLSAAIENGFHDVAAMNALRVPLKTAYIYTKEPSKLIDRIEFYKLVDFSTLSVNKKENLLPEEGVVDIIEKGAKINITAGMIAVVKLKDDERLSADGLETCSALMCLGKEKNGGFVYILGHIFQRYTFNKELVNEQFELIKYIIIEKQQLAEIEVYVDVGYDNTGVWNKNMQLFKNAIEEAGINLKTDRSRDFFRYDDAGFSPYEGTVWIQKYTFGRNHLHVNPQNTKTDEYAWTIIKHNDKKTPLLQKPNHL